MAKRYVKPADIGAIPDIAKGQAGGVAPLDPNSKIPSIYIPKIATTEVYPVVSEAEMLALTAERGDEAHRTDTGQVFLLMADDPSVLSNWLERVSGGGVADHGELTGLDVDDHGLYALTDGSRGDFAPTVAPFVNIMPDSGRFGGKMDPVSLVQNSVFANPTFLNPYNGTTVGGGGQFGTDNSTNGGSGPALTQNVQDLLTAMGRTGVQARYGVEFYVASYTMGSGTALSKIGPDGVARYEMTVNGNKAMFGFASKCSFACWIRIKSAGTAQSDAIDTIAPTKINGLEIPKSSSLISVADGWTHLLMQASDPLGYVSIFPFVRARAGDIVQIALPAFFAGPVDPGVHVAPLPTVNELIGN